LRLHAGFRSRTGCRLGVPGTTTGRRSLIDPAPGARP
jgi:hypothetical protein